MRTVCRWVQVGLFSDNLRLFGIHFAFFLPIVLALQFVTGIYSSELSHQPDESAHVVTSLMIHDYVKTGIGTSPLRFAKDYYIHYPKVAIGIWPPFFHMMAALWMLVFSRTHLALLIFIAIPSASCAATLAVFARRLIPPLAASGLGLLLAVLPAFQNATSTVMVDVFLAMMLFWVMLLMITVFRDQSMLAAVGFGILTGLAMLTKGNANALPLCGVLMLLLTRCWSVLRRPAIYVASALVLLLGGPWQTIMLHSFQRHGNPLEQVSVARFGFMISSYTSILIDRLGLPLFLFALLGLTVECIPLAMGRREGPRSFDIAGAASLVAAIVLFHSMAPVGLDDRYMISILPMLLLFAALGIRWVVLRVPAPPLSVTAKAAVLTGLCLLWFAKYTFTIAYRPAMGFAKVATELVPATAPEETVLVCSDSWGEGALITSIALTDRSDARHIILRGSKVLSINGWVTTDYRPLFENAAQLEAYLEQMPVDAIVVDLSGTVWEQDRALLRLAIRNNPDKWLLASEFPNGPSSRHLQLYRWAGPDHAERRRSIVSRMRILLDRDLELH